eukprot:2321692-Rhodomonas_salina.1
MVLHSTGHQRVYGARSGLRIEAPTGYRDGPNALPASIRAVLTFLNAGFCTRPVLRLRHRANSSEAGSARESGIPEGRNNTYCGVSLGCMDRTRVHWSRVPGFYTGSGTHSNGAHNVWRTRGRIRYAIS